MLNHVRTCAAAAAVAAVLAVSGCSSDGSDGSDDAKKDETPSASDNEQGTSGSSGDGSDDAAQGSIEGSWATVADGKPAALVVQGTKVAVAGAHVCSGTAAQQDGKHTLELSCKDGNTDRNRGTVTSVDDKTLKVEWDGAGEETFTKADGSELPDGLPTEAVPSS